MAIAHFRQSTVGLLILAALTGNLWGWAKSADEWMKDASGEFTRGNYKGAERNYQHALQENPQHAYARVGLACSLLEQGRVAEAEQQLQQLMRQSPDFAPAYYLQGRLLEEKGQTQQARAAFQQYVTRSRGNIPPDPSIRLKLRKYGVL